MKDILIVFCQKGCVTNDRAIKGPMQQSVSNWQCLPWSVEATSSTFSVSHKVETECCIY